jgi:polysaccharide biosynthesis transport protein
MLNDNRLRTTPQLPSIGPAQESDLSSFDLVGLIRRQWKVVGACVTLALVLGGIYVAVTPPTYVATTQLIIDVRNVQPPLQQAITPEPALDAVFIDSQVEVLRSEAIRLAVVQRLELTRDEEFVGARGNIFRLISALFDSLSYSRREVNEGSHSDLTERALVHLLRNVSVRRVARTYVLEITFRSSDRAKAAAIANVFASSYLLEQSRASSDSAKRASDWLENRLAEIREEVVKADRAVQTFVSENNLIGASPDRTLMEQQLSEVNSQLVLARAQVAESKARLDRVVAIEAKEINNPAVADALNNPVITKIRDEYLAAARREADFSARYGASHPAVVDLQRELEQLRIAARDEFRRIAEAYRSEYEIAKSREKSLEASFRDAIEAAALGKQAGVSLRLLESTAQSTRKVYDSLLQKLADSTQLESFPRTEARVITPARRGQKSQPEIPVVAIASIIAGLFVGLGIAFVRDRLDSSLKTAREIENLLSTECLGIIPEIKSKARRRNSQVVVAPDGSVPQRCLTLRNGLDQQVVHAPFSMFAETLHRVKVALDMRASSSVILGVTSILPREGRTTIAVNLAQVLAASGDRTLLIDVDLRRPTLTDRIAAGASAGLVELIGNKAKIDELIWHDPITNLDFLPAVLQEPIASRAALLSSAAAETLLAELRTRYRYVLLDLPPLAPVVDAKAMSELVDAFLLVIEWGETHPAAIQETLNATDIIQSRLVGAVLNRADIDELKLHEHHKGTRFYESCG